MVALISSTKMIVNHPVRRKLISSKIKQESWLAKRGLSEQARREGRRMNKKSPTKTRRKTEVKNKKGVSFFYASLLLLAGASLLSLNSCTIDPDPPDRYALVYGVSDYSNIDSSGDSNLNFTDDDAYEVGKLLASKGFSVYLRIDDGTNSNGFDVSFAENMKSASTSQLDDDLTMMESILGEDDIFVFFFSGHGTYDASATASDEDAFSDSYNEYILLYPTEDASEKILLSDDALGAAMFYLPSIKNVILLDSCNSGGFINQQNDIDRLNPEYSSDSEYRSNIFKLSIEAYFNSSNVDIPPSEAIVISASGEQEFSWEAGDTNGNGHGFLSRGILGTPSGGDINNDGYIDTREIYYYTRRFIETNWNPSWQEIQKDLLNKTGRYYTQEEIQFLPRISGGAVDFVLFEAD